MKFGILVDFVILVETPMGGFQCPPPTQSGAQHVAHTLHADDSDCRGFFICINGETPRPGGCDLGKVFSTETNICETPDKVPEW